MGAKENKSMQNEEQNTITLSKNGIISYLNNKLATFKKKSEILSNLKILMDEGRNNSLNENNKWTNYKDDKYTEKGIEIFSCELNCSSFSSTFELKYYYYNAYYLEYNNFRFLNSKDEKDFSDIRQTIDENFKRNHNNKEFKNEVLKDNNSGIINISNSDSDDNDDTGILSNRLIN